MEEYKPVKDFETIYEVSNKGKMKYINGGNVVKTFINKHGYEQVVLINGTKRKYVSIHQLVAEAFLEKVEGKTEIDHRNCDKSNNDVSNLRYCSHQENCRNKKMMITNKSGVKGVNWCKIMKMWRARIKIDNKRIHLGFYNDIEDARKARVERAIKEFGEFINECELENCSSTKKE
jgi:hypothetical protein